MARDRPSPYVNGGGVFFIVARGTGPRERGIENTIPLKSTDSTNT